jgi:hypothetical protein
MLGQRCANNWLQELTQERDSTETTQPVESEREAYELIKRQLKNV